MFTQRQAQKDRRKEFQDPARRPEEECRHKGHVQAGDGKPVFLKTGRRCLFSPPARSTEAGTGNGSGFFIAANTGGAIIIVMVEWILQNKEWLFSGVGLTVLLVIWRLLAYLHHKKEVHPIPAAILPAPVPVIKDPELKKELLGYLLDSPCVNSLSFMGL